MDEATSNIDQYTDRKIQNILKHQCDEMTIGKFQNLIEDSLESSEIWD